MIPRWWRVGVLFLENGDLFSQTFHVRAAAEPKARELVAEALDHRPHAIHVCHPSDPLRTAPRKEFIAATYGPYPRSLQDPAIKSLPLCSLPNALQHKYLRGE